LSFSTISVGVLRGKMIADETEKWSKAGKASGAKAE
jgi:hypothetical protein